MIDPKQDAPGALDEVQFLAKHVDTATLRQMIDAALLEGLRRAIRTTRRDNQDQALPAARVARVIVDFGSNLLASFRSAATEAFANRPRVP